MQRMCVLSLLFLSIGCTPMASPETEGSHSETSVFHWKTVGPPTYFPLEDSIPLPGMVMVEDADGEQHIALLTNQSGTIGEKTVIKVTRILVRPAKTHHGVTPTAQFFYFATEQLKENTPRAEVSSTETFSHSP